MASFNAAAVPLCSHSTLAHFLRHPLCIAQSTVQKTFNVAVPILIAGLAITLCYIVYCRFVRPCSLAKPPLNESGIKKMVGVTQVKDGSNTGNSGSRKSANPEAKPKVKDDMDDSEERINKNLPKDDQAAEMITPYSAEAAMAIASSSRILIDQFLSNRDIEVHVFKNKQGCLTQPENKQIAALSKVYYLLWTDFRTKIYEFSNRDPWRNPVVLAMANKLVEVAFTISCLTLEEFKDISKESRAYAISDPDSFSAQTFLTLPRVYNSFRCEYGYEEGDSDTEEGYFAKTGSDISRAHALSFYKEGTMQSHWRKLKNEYDALVGEIIPRSELKEVAPAFDAWTQPDISVGSYIDDPDETIPPIPEQNIIIKNSIPTPRPTNILTSRMNPPTVDPSSSPTIELFET